MKSCLSVLVALTCLPLFASATTQQKGPQRPATLECQIQIGHNEGLPNTFTIEKLNTAEPEISIPDAGLMEDLDEQKLAASSILQLSFSNECDNMYDIVLFTADLEKLAKGKVAQVAGLISGGNADIDLDQVAGWPISCHAK